MQHDWILDVLADLKAYAVKNGLTALAHELDEATLIAAAESASVQGKGPGVSNQTARSTGLVY